MAKENQGQNSDSESDSEDKGRDKKKFLMLAVLGLIVVGISVGGTLMAVKILGPKEVSTGEDVTAEEKEPERAPAIYYPIKPPIIVNYDARGRQRYVQAEITLMFRDEDVMAAIELHMPMIRDTLMMIISGQVYEEVQTAEGKELLRLKCLDDLQKMMEKEIGKPAIEQVFFTGFVMQ